jgi:large subunit ribosomal protein L30
MIAVIRIGGIVKMNKDVEETMFRTRLRRKFVLTLLENNEETRRLLLKIRNFVAYGEISEEVLKELIEKRAEQKDKTKKFNIESIIKEISKNKPSEWSIKPFFRLHPPIGGIDSKKHFGVTSKAVLGNNKEKINDLIRRML